MIEAVGLDVDGETVSEIGFGDVDDEGEGEESGSASSTSSEDELSSYEECTDSDSDESSYLDSSDEEELLEAIAGMDLTRQTTAQSLRRCWSADAIASKGFSAGQVSALLSQFRNTGGLKPSPVMSFIQAGAPDQVSTVVRSNAHRISSKQFEAERRPSAASLPPSMQRSSAPEKHCEENQEVCPTAVLSEILLSESGKSFSELLRSDVDDYFVPISEDRILSYTTEIVGAIRNEDINSLRRMHFDEKANLDCCNQFGESVLHMACRLNLPRVVHFLIHEAKVDLRVRDDYGRTPMHDACWAPDFNKELVLLLVTEWPDLLFVKDKRGSTPLSYIRKAQWGEWSTFLTENKELLRPKMLLSLDPAEESGQTHSPLSAVSA